jgi:hypothetical protein
VYHTHLHGQPFEHIKNMELLIKRETDWLAAHANEYDTPTYQSHMEKSTKVINRLIKVIFIKIQSMKNCFNFTVILITF